MRPGCVARRRFAGDPSDDTAAAAEEIQRRRYEIGIAYFVFGAEVCDALAPAVAEVAAT
jgi:hypothetical protein